MKSKSLFSGLIFFLIASLATAGTIPTIKLEEGSNSISFSITNTWNTDISNLTVQVDKNVLPGWLNIKGDLQSINVRSGEKGSEKIYLTFTVTDAPLGAEVTIPLVLEDVAGNKWNYTVNLCVQSVKPQNYMLYENFPNPFNPSTTISYSLAKNSPIKLIIYNSLGQKVKTLINETQTAGFHKIQWNGDNDYGERVSSGTYFYRMTTGSFEKTQRMILIK